MAVLEREGRVRDCKKGKGMVMKAWLLGPVGCWCWISRGRGREMLGCIGVDGVGDGGGVSASC